MCIKKRLKVAMVAACPFPYPRGTPTRILRMSQTLSDLGIDVHVITYHLGQDIDTGGGITIHRIPNLKFYKKTSPGPSFLKLIVIDPILILNLLQLHRTYKYDLIHAHHFEGLLATWPIKMFGHTPIIFDSHTLLASELHHYDLFLPKNLIRKLGIILDRYLPKFSDYIICVSKQIKSQLINDARIPPKKISLIPNGLELDHFFLESLNERSLDKTTPILGFAGNFAKYQGIDKMLTAVSILRKSYPGIKLNIYSSDLSSEYLTMIESLGIAGRVEMIPTSYQQLPECLSQVDILLNPRSDGAGTPLKLINYMSAGKPIVSFAGSAHEIIHGETGWIVSNDTADAFSEGIKWILSNQQLAHKMGKNARNFVKANFSWRSRGEEIIEIYNMLGKTSQYLP